MPKITEKLISDQFNIRECCVKITRLTTEDLQIYSSVRELRVNISVKEFENEWKETILKRHGIRECCVKISRLTPKGIPNVQLNPCDGETEDVMSIENETRKGLYSTPSVGSVRSHVPWLPIKPTLNSSSFLFRGNK